MGSWTKAWREIQASQATRVRRVKKVWLVLKVHLVKLAHKVLLGQKVKMERKGNKDHLDLKVTLDYKYQLLCRYNSARSFHKNGAHQVNVQNIIQKCTTLSFLILFCTHLNHNGINISSSIILQFPLQQDRATTVLGWCIERFKSWGCI